MSFNLPPVPVSNGACTPIREMKEKVRGKQSQPQVRREVLHGTHILPQLANAIEQSPVSVMLTDRTGRIVYVNPKLCEITGYSQEELIGNTPRIFKSGESAHEIYRTLWRTITDGNPWSGEFHNRKKNGELFWESASISPVRDAQNEITHFLAVKEDITEKKRLEAQLLRAQRMESIGTLASGVAHDLNNILAPIMMSVPMLRLGLSNDEILNIVNTIETSAERGAQIVRQVLSFGRGMDGQRVPIQLTHLVKELTKITRETFPKDVKVELSLPPDLAQVSGDATQLHQVLLNLCINARDAMPNGGTLRIQASNFKVDSNYASMVPEALPGQYVLIEVHDTGVGISPKIIDQIFDPFFTTKPIGKGTGLGLSTVHGIVKNHGGFTLVESRKGTIFKIFLPVAPEEDAANDSDGGIASEPAPRGNGELVLVVDDEAAVREATKIVLHTYGYRALLAEDGAAALALFAEQSSEIAAVLTDIVMPIIDGVAVVQVLRKMSPTVPIIAVSGKHENARLNELESNNISAFLRKPFCAETIMQVLSVALRMARRVEEKCADRPGVLFSR